MEQDTAFVLSYLKEEVRRIRRHVAVYGGHEDVRGGSFLRLSEVLLDHLEEQADVAVSDEFKGAEDLGARSLLRLVPLVWGADELVSTYRDDVGRDDLPVGLLYFVDMLVQSLLAGAADPLVHLAPGNVYATEPLAQVVREIAPGLDTLIEEQELNPVVFNLPQIAPANFLLSPILVHEVAHTAVEQGLYEVLIERWDAGAINVAFDTQFQAMVQMVGVEDARTADLRNEWRERFAQWTEEHLCDALGIVLMGPSYLFALAVFLPAPAHGNLGTHPYPRDRIAQCLGHLGELGWTEVLREILPEVIGWCEGLAPTQRLQGDPQEVFLRRAAEISQATVLEVACELIPPQLEPGRFVDYQEQLVALIQAGIPPVEFDTRAAMPWEIVLAGWIAALVAHGGQPADLVPAAASDAMNALLTKSVELASIKRLWDAE